MKVQALGQSKPEVGPQPRIRTAGGLVFYKSAEDSRAGGLGAERTQKREAGVRAFFCKDRAGRALRRKIGGYLIKN